MMPTQPYALTIKEASELIRGKKLSPVELVDSVLGRIAETDSKVHAYCLVLADEARAAAVAAEEEISSTGWKGTLHGIPVGLKDLYFTAGVPTKAGSRILKDFIPDYDSTVAERLKAHGAIILGKTVTHEFAYGRNIPPTRNPWHLDLYPGGSSAGSGVSVAVDSAMAAFGTDTGGSLRIPGAINGVVALKPTFGRISKYGIIPMSPTMDHAGPLTKTVEDCALIMNQISGYDPCDLTSIDVAVPDFTSALNCGVKGLRLGIERDYFFYERTSHEVGKAMAEVFERMEELGATLVEVSIPNIEFAVPASRIIVTSDSSFYHQRWLRKRPEDYESGTRLMLELGEFIPATAYLRALHIRKRIRTAIRDTFMQNQLDVLLTPTIPVSTLPLRQSPTITNENVTETMFSVFSHNLTPFNLSGQPALCIPCGLSAEYLPIGLQIVGRPFDESTVLQVGHAYESATNWHKISPPL